MLFLSCYALATYAEDTVLKLYRPFGDDVEHRVPEVKKKFAGHCLTQSQRILREDAWRCMAEGVTFDPCFAKAGPKQTSVICPQSPWESSNVVIELSEPLNNEQHQALDMSRTFPWAIELVSGEHCQAIESRELFDAMPIRYHCSSGNDLVGHIQRCKLPWTMLEKTPQGVVTVELKKAWF